MYRERSQADNHAEEWMKVFVAHVGKLYPKVFSDSGLAPRNAGGPSGSASLSSASGPTWQPSQNAQYALTLNDHGPFSVANYIVAWPQPSTCSSQELDELETRPFR